MKNILLLFMLNFISFLGNTQDNFLEKLMETQPQHFENILKNKGKYEVQIFFTQINRNHKNKPSFKTYSYQADANHYFYPASTVKLPACLLALEKINKLNIKGLSKESAMITKTDFEKQTSVSTDSTSQNGLPSIAHYIKKILMVSDNDAFNRLYEFIGQKDFNESLWKKGYTNTRIMHRLQIALSVEQNKHTNPIEFYNGNALLYSQKGQYNELNFFPKEPIKKGIGYFGPDEKLVNEPFDFILKNKFALIDQHTLLKSLIFPE
ncbi:MAG: serine hydrolase, partial [Bacteroidota bacterium]